MAELALGIVQTASLITGNNFTTLSAAAISGTVAPNVGSYVVMTAGLIPGLVIFSLGCFSISYQMHKKAHKKSLQQHWAPKNNR